MAEINKDWEDKAKSTFSAERREDFVVMVIAAIAVVLVLTGTIGPKFFGSLFF